MEFRKYFFNNFLILFLFFILTSCQKTTVIENAVFDNNLLNKMNFNSENIEINNLYKTSIEEPFIDHIMEITPEERIYSWLKTNIISFGTENKLVINIINASITQNEIPYKENKKNLLNKETQYIYKINLIINLNIIGDNNVNLASTKVEVNRSKTSSKFISINERNKTLNLLTWQALQDLSNKSKELIKIHMMGYFI